MIFYAENQNRIETEDEPLAKGGGEGAVYRIRHNTAFPNHCAKIFHADRLKDGMRQQKLAYMIANKPAVTHQNHFKICWPEALLFSNGIFAGYIMPLAFAGSEKLYDIVQLQVSHTLSKEWHTKFNRTDNTGIINRLKICTNIAVAVSSVHQAGYYTLVDFKPQNVLMTLDGKISLIDIDSIQIAQNGRVLFPAQVATPEYTPPEGSKLKPARDVIRSSWDRFSIAVCFYEILLGLHPFAGSGAGQYANCATLGEKIEAGLYVHGSKRSELSVIPPPHAKFKSLSAGIQQLFYFAFDAGHTAPDARPTADQWGALLFNEVKTLQTAHPKPVPKVRTVSKPLPVITEAP
ncbi:MAG: hypothetical protein EBX41_09400 [Chitinophagia bacterium]|nr:hypothetical protein [Chitinophagia bacterium]